jgi:hypothetical protein
MESNGRDDVDQDALVESCPLPCEVLQAASVINRYTEELNDSLACKLEASLGHLCHQIQLESFKSMKPSSLLDYFKSS